MTTTAQEFVPGIPATRIEQHIPPAPVDFHSWLDCLFDMALKEFTTEDTADETADACAVILSDPDNPYTQHVHDALRMLVCHAQAARVEREFGESILRRFREAAL